MATLLHILVAGATVLLTVPVVIVFAEVLLALAGRNEPAALEPPADPTPRLAILIPAHDEASILAGTLRAIVPQLRATDRLLVVADNCTDDTACIAASEGAEVVVRQDSTRRGKGYALDFGVRHLQSDAPAVVLVIDADCRPAAGSIDRLARACARSARPAQALYLMHAGDNASVQMRIAEFAWVIKNQVRPMGLRRLGLPCQLMGTGMAFPWPCIRSVELATGHIVEDLKLGIDLARAGTPPFFCPEALVTSQFPTSREGIKHQRTRWEHGHLSLILNEAPRLLWHSAVTLNAGSLALALDLSVPPLALLMLLVVLSWLTALILFVFTKSVFALALSSSTMALFAISVLLSWRTYGRHVISLPDLALAIIRAVLKIPLYFSFLVARQSQWVRSERDQERRRNERP